VVQYKRLLLLETMVANTRVFRETSIIWS